MSRKMRSKVRNAKYGGGSWRLLLAGLLVMLIGSILVVRAGIGVLTRPLATDSTPMTFWIASPQLRADWHLRTHEHTPDMAPTDHLPEAVPGIVVVHGLAASQRLMLGYAHALARAGYGVMLVDVSGHGRNTAPFSAEAVQQDVERAYQELLRQPEVDASRVALLGHSMGGSAVLRAASAQPERYAATVAISAVGGEVDTTAPRNLQLQAGAWEPGFVAAAGELLQQAGGPSQDFAGGRARELLVVDRADHLGILFRDASQQAAREWFDRAFHPDLTQRDPYRDLRMPGWLMLVGGAMLLVLSLERAFAQPSGTLRAPWHALAALAAPFAGAALAAVLLRIVDIDRVLGMPIAGTVAVWLGLGGALILAVGVRLRRPRRRQLLWALGLFAFLWLVVGMSAELVWLQWTLVGPRLWRWVLLAAACAPWFIGLAACQQLGRHPAWAWWLGSSVTGVAGALLLSTLLPGLGLLHLIVPLLPLFLGIATVCAARTNDPWAAGIGNALFFGWLLASSMPLLP